MSIIYDEQARGLAFTEIAQDILHGAQTELYMNMRFLDVALSSLSLLADGQIRTAGTDGTIYYFQPDKIADVFRKGREAVNRLYLHSILHCLFAHIWTRENRDAEYWNLACDIAAEHVIDGLYIRALHRPMSAFRREVYRSVTDISATSGRSSAAVSASGRESASGVLSASGRQAPSRSSSDNGTPLTAQRIYRQLIRIHPVQARLDQLKREFAVDDHSRWETDSSSPMPPQKPSSGLDSSGSKNEPQPNAPSDSAPSDSKKKWDDIRDRMQTEMETFGKDASDDAKVLEEQVCAVNRKRYDYRDFLRKFSVLKEEMQVDMDSFDYIYYNYGMELYGSIPLIEPLETKEVKKIEDFVIVLDTSMSCQGELLLAFLEETCSILSESESFFRKIHIHILQCDDQVQEDVLITNQDEMRDYLEHFTIRGYGGTDFRPPFSRVQELMCRGCFTKLRGLIYFTDGYGTFPVKKPPYDTAFVFLREDYRDVDVPPWAIKLIVDREDLEHAVPPQRM
ncbi:MAG: VWA-like domain-containing protein [Clostridiales bacterium]|nr:VWA-like domain-containing protein [Clostridiales bacterium]